MFGSPIIQHRTACPVLFLVYCFAQLVKKVFLSVHIPGLSGTFRVYSRTLFACACQIQMLCYSNTPHLYTLKCYQQTSVFFQATISSNRTLCCPASLSISLLPHNTTAGCDEALTHDIWVIVSRALWIALQSSSPLREPREDHLLFWTGGRSELSIIFLYAFSEP